jgi:integrase
MLQVMRDNGGHESADLCELLAYSGCRKSEIVGDEKYKKGPLLWRDINFELGTFTVTRSKNHKARVVPLFPAMESFLHRLKARRESPPRGDESVIGIGSAAKAIETACKEIGLPKSGHHLLRHFFCSNAIEAGVDFKVIAGWLGHVDGGVLVAKTYGHLRDTHSMAMAKRITFDAAAETPPNVVPMSASDE